MENKGLVPFMDLAHNSLLMPELMRKLIHLAKRWHVCPP